MKSGVRYEEFVYEKFRRLFEDAAVTKNDKILGLESGLEREIDVSVRMKEGEADLLYITQCKDWQTRVDIKVLGEFASVMQDVRAAKGSLLCTAGFAKTNHRYALTKGIELVTIEDVQSDRWKVDVQIPLVYVKKKCEFALTLDVVVNATLAERNRDRELSVELSAGTPLTTDAGTPSLVSSSSCAIVWRPCRLRLKERGSTSGTHSSK